MRTRVLGSTKRRIPIVGQGTWQMELDDGRAAIAALRAGLDAKMTHIDTAELYGWGKVEQMVAKAIAGRRDHVYLVSKVYPDNASRKGTLLACERSLRRLGTDHLDLYLLHWPGEHPLEDTFAAFDQLEREGKIAAFGVSNFDVADLEEAVALVGAERIACNQVLYHLRERAIEHRILPWCRRRGIPIVGYSPFGSGRFPSPRSQGGAALARVAERRDATVRQVALAYLTRSDWLFTIPKTAHADYARENAAAGRLELSSTDLRQLDAAFPRGPGRGLPSL